VKRKTVLINAGLALVLVGVAAGSVFAVNSSPATSTTTPSATVTRGTVTKTVSASGNLSAKNTIGVDFSGSGGTVTEIEVKVGDKVTAGQALAKVDDTSAKQSLATATASLLAAKAQKSTTTEGLTSQEKARNQAQVRSAQVSVTNASTSVKQAQATYGRDKKNQDALVNAAQAAYDNAGDPAAKANAKPALTQAQNTRASTLLRDSQQIETARGQLNSAQAALSTTKASNAVDAQPARSGSVKSAEAQVASAEVQVEQAQSTVDQTTLRAPIDGTVVSISGTVGGPSTAGAASSNASTSSTSSSTTSGFLVLSDMSELQVSTYVAEADAGNVEVGQHATVTFPALDVTAAGTVTSIDLASTVNNNVVEYGVTVTLDDPSSDLRLGQTASVNITVGSKADVLYVPSSAITKVGNFSTVVVRKDDGEATTQVGTGLVGDNGTEITSGLSEGDVVVLSTSTDSGGGFTFPGGGFGGGLGQ
jgi:multidrug efflux pump subunit AcrA (membrane-fusion protein)